MEQKPLTPEAMKHGGAYNWKHAERDRLIYLGKKGAWHQFKKIGDPREVWCEVLDEDMHMLEETADVERCKCGYPMPCATTVPIGFCKA